METSLSVLAPVYNEQLLVYAPLERLKLLETSPQLERADVIVVEDCSKNETARVLETVPMRTSITTPKILYESSLCLLD